MHDNAFKVANDLANSAAATQRVLEARSKDYIAWSQAIMDERFAPDPTKDASNTEIARWVKDEAKNGDGGYRNIREAIDENLAFANVIYNTDWRLLGLPKDQAQDFKERAVKRWAPEALEYIDRALELDRLAAKYPLFSKRVHSSFYSKHELAKMATRFKA